MFRLLHSTINPWWRFKCYCSASGFCLADMAKVVAYALDWFALSMNVVTRTRSSVKEDRRRWTSCQCCISVLFVAHFAPTHCCLLVLIRFDCYVVDPCLVLVDLLYSWSYTSWHFQEMPEIFLNISGIIWIVLFILSQDLLWLYHILKEVTNFLQKFLSIDNLCIQLFVPSTSVFIPTWYQYSPYIMTES